MKFIFIIQGEGKGHHMQSVAFREILEEEGHEIIRIFFGRSLKNLISSEDNTIHSWNSDFFISPYFISTKKHQGIDLGITFLINLLLIPLYLIEILRLGMKIRNSKPDIIINFYDIIGGIACLFAGSSIRKYVISHHFFFSHPDFKWPRDRRIERILLLIHSSITAFSAQKKLAISFSPSQDIPEKKIFITPPLIRKKILKADPSDEGHIHIYTLYPGYYFELEEWCKNHPEIHVRMFSHFNKVPATKLSNLQYFSFNTDTFLDSLITCSRTVCTAGFETLAEASFLGKHLEVVPTKNHFEQYCNAIDLERSRLGKKKNSLLPFLPITDSPQDQPHLSFKEWTEKAGKVLLSHLEI